MDFFESFDDEFDAGDAPCERCGCVGLRRPKSVCWLADTLWRSPQNLVVSSGPMVRNVESRLECERCGAVRAALLEHRGEDVDDAAQPSCVSCCPCCCLLCLYFLCRSIACNKQFWKNQIQTTIATCYARTSCAPCAVVSCVGTSTTSSTRNSKNHFRCCCFFLF